MPTIPVTGSLFVQFFNLSLLTSDVYAAAARILFFGSFTKRSGAIFSISCALVVTGLVCYFTTPETQASIKDAIPPSDLHDTQPIFEAQVGCVSASEDDTRGMHDRQTLLKPNGERFGPDDASENAEAVEPAV
jgi:hypothetical protein